MTVLEASPEAYEERLTEMSPGAFRNLRLFALDPHDLASPSSGATASGTGKTFSLAKSAPLDIATLQVRYRQMRPYLGNPGREDLTLKLWIDAIEERWNGNG